MYDTAQSFHVRVVQLNQVNSHLCYHPFPHSPLSFVLRALKFVLEDIF